MASGRSVRYGRSKQRCVPVGRAGRLLGVHIVGPWATELMVEGWLAVNWEATPGDLAQLIHPHPTLSETFGDTALAFIGRGLHG